MAEPEKITEKLQQNYVFFLTQRYNCFKFYFQRFLLATNNITFDTFYNAIGSKYPTFGNRWCLSLPETTLRAAEFDERNKYDFLRLCGLRHAYSWVGCGLSYKFFMKLAKRERLEQVAICEDDVEFFDDFEDKFARANRYLSSRKGWDLFAGLIADASDDTKILDYEKNDGIAYADIDRVVSMVFNIYHHTFFNALDGWDEHNFNASENTIDRYIERKENIRAVVMCPYLVGHLDETYSTLWNFKNTQYTDMIKISETKLLNKIAEFVASKTTSDTAKHGNG